MGDNATAIIPARLGSTRFPGKVLKADTGKPMVVHVCDQAAKAASVGRVVVATDTEEIASAVRAAGYEPVMTSADHPNGTSRLHEAASTLGLTDQDIIVNVQGDEPELEPGLIDAAVEALAAHTVSTVASPFATTEDPSAPSIVKAVVASIDDHGLGTALYFSRALVPHDRDGDGLAPLKHVGLYAYRAADLARYVAWPESPLERSERLEQLRWLEHGATIGVAVREATHHGIDTPADYTAFVARFRNSDAGS